MNFLLVKSPYTGKSEYLNTDLIKEIYVTYEIQENAPREYCLKVSVKDQGGYRILKEYLSQEEAMEAMVRIAFKLAGPEGRVIKVDEDKEI